MSGSGRTPSSRRRLRRGGGGLLWVRKGALSPRTVLVGRPAATPDFVRSVQMHSVADQLGRDSINRPNIGGVHPSGRLIELVIGDDRIVARIFVGHPPRPSVVYITLIDTLTLGQG